MASAYKPEKMSEDKLNAFLDSELRNTIGYGMAGDEISAQREQELRMYLNYPVGDEEEGRSKLQDSSIQDVVEGFLPGALAPFISSDKVVEFEPAGEEDKAQAEIATPYVNHIVMVDNPGVQIQYTWMKDAFLQKNGFVYAEWQEKERTRRIAQRVGYSGLLQYTQDPEIEIIQYSAFDAAGQPIDPAMLESGVVQLEALDYEVDFRRRWKEGRVTIRNIPPEYTIVTKTATCEDDARMIGWMERVTISDLREEGYDEAKLEKINFSDTGERPDDPSGERTTREQRQGGLNSDTKDGSTDPAGREVWRTVVWTRVDFDGDGKAELRKIVRAGGRMSGGVVLFNEEADEVPVISFTPIPMPHQLFGRSLAELAKPIQEAKTAMLRMVMDATYHTVYPRYKLLEQAMSDDTYDDLMLNIPGTPVRMNGDAVQPLNDAPDIGAAYQALEFFDRQREVRTPVTRQMQGVDPDVINDSSATEAKIQANASSQRQELVLRLYAEALSKLCRLVLRLVIKHQDKPRQMRLMNKVMEVDPRYWNADMDVSVRVGLGTGTKDQQVQGLMAIIQKQMEQLQLGLPTVDPSKLYNSSARLVESMGLTMPEMYFNDPDQQQQMQQQAPQGPSPEQQQAEAEQVQAAIDNAKEQGKQEGADAVKLEEIASKERMQERELGFRTVELQTRQQENVAQAQGLNV